MPICTTIDEARPRIGELVRRFRTHAAGYTCAGSGYNETALRTQFLNPLLQALGWDVENEKTLSPDLQEVVYEPTLEDRAEKLSRRPDYEMRLARQKKFYVEAKRPSVNIETDKGATFQTRRYGFSAGLPVAILTNFYRFVVYDCQPIPNEDDDPRVARLSVYTFEELESRLDEVWSVFSREAVYVGRFDEKYAVEVHRQGTSQFDEFFLKQVKKWRELLATDIASRNRSLSGEELTYIVQRILNRIVFLRICEDRELEKYETLKGLSRTRAYTTLRRLLEAADRKYDSGLFNLIDDPSVNIEVGDDALLSVVAELYYPQSPYTFAVVDPAVLGEIYELFLEHEIVVRGRGKVTIEQKAETRAGGGVAATPRYVVDQIIERTMSVALSNRSPPQLEHFAVADISCGSGVFLVEAFKFLMDSYLSWYVHDGAEKHKESLFEAGPNRFRLTLHEKRRILLDHIFGVDIDPQAVEVAHFSLLLQLIEGETQESIDVYRRRFKEGALPSLDDHVVCGNSLVDHEHLKTYLPDVSDELLRKLNPLDWSEQFRATGGTFDVIVGNPPYIRIQNMVGYSPDEVRFYQDAASGYQCSRTDNFDKYALFVERALSLLRPEGRLGYILPHKFFTLRSGERLREMIASRKHLGEIVYFGAQQVFARTRTYTCILVLSKPRQDQFKVEHVTDLKRWRYGVPGTIVTHPVDEIGAQAWSFVPEDAKLLFDRLRSRHPTRLGDVAEVFVGVQTSMDKVFIIKPLKETRNLVHFVDLNQTRGKIEKGILRPSLLDVQLHAFSKPKANTCIIFPYEIVGGKARLYGPGEMKRQFPLAWDYLKSFEAKLKARNIQNATPRTWYQYGRSQSLTKFQGEKLIVPTFSTEPRCAYDDANIVVTGGGNGPYYLIRPRPGQRLSIFYLQAILCHPVMEAMVRSASSAFRGGYYSHGKQFIEGLPVADVDWNDDSSKNAHDEIVRLVCKLIENSELREAARTPRLTSIYERHRETLLGDLMKRVDQMYAIREADWEVAESVQIPT